MISDVDRCASRQFLCGALYHALTTSEIQSQAARIMSLHMGHTSVTVHEDTVMYDITVPNQMLVSLIA